MKLSQFTVVEFDKTATCHSFITKWIEERIQNSNGKPVYAHMDLPPELRALRYPLTQVERKIKRHFERKKEKHEVRTNWNKTPAVITVDKEEVVRFVHGLLMFLDTELEGELSDFDEDM